MENNLFTVIMDHNEDMEILNFVTNDIETAIGLAYSQFAEIVLIEEGNTDESYRFLLKQKINELRKEGALKEVTASKVRICLD